MNIGKYKFLGTFESLRVEIEANEYVICIGENQGRKMVSQRILQKGGSLTNAIHPKSYISPGSSIGVGNIVFPFAYIGTGISLGNGNIVFPFTSITHHSKVGDFTFMAPNVSIGGHSEIGDLAKFGMGANIVAHSNVPSNYHLLPGQLFGSE